MAGALPFYECQAESSQGQTSDDPLEGGVHGVSVVTSKVHDGVGFSAQDSAGCVAQCAEQAKEDANGELAARESQVLTGSEGKGDTGEDDQSAEDLCGGKSVAKPDPFDGGGQGCREALNEKDG